MGSKNVKGWCSGSYKSDYSPGPQKGVPYDWGGFDTIAGFDEDIADGYGAGSHSWHGVLECTTGVDCSGFVSRCWETTKKYGTATINEVSHSISKGEMLGGDAWNKPGSHIVLWVGKSADGGPIFYEASGSASKVRLNSAASWSYLEGYSPIRYDDFDQQTGPTMIGGTVSAPIVISAFPFHHEADTTKSASDVFDTYSCAAGTGEKGPEVVYKVELVSNGTLVATVSDSSSVDVDVQLLKTPSSADCIARDDTTVKASLSAGTYWLVVDSWSDSSGISYGGKYALDVTFSNQAPPLQPGSGTFSNPIPIEGFPFHDERTTSGALSDVANAYACAPEKGEKGPEVVYRFTVTVAGKVKATVVDGSGVDVDLHLLWAPEPSACLARHDTKFEVAIEPGTYWIVADTWSDSDGDEYPGPYALDVSFASDTPCVPACAGKQCGWNGCWGWCGTCKSGELCQAGVCVSSNTCGDGKCEPLDGEKCDTCFPDCPCGCGQTCLSGVCALTACAGRNCGPDGCGGYCGQCAETDYCDKGTCAPLSGTLPKIEPCEGPACESPENEGDRPPPEGWDEDAISPDGWPAIVVEDPRKTSRAGSGSCSSSAGSAGGGAMLLALLAIAALGVKRDRLKGKAGE